MHISVSALVLIPVILAPLEIAGVNQYCSLDIAPKFLTGLTAVPMIQSPATNPFLDFPMYRKKPLKFELAKQKGYVGDSTLREARVMWFDATANIDTLNSRAGVIRILDKCKKANINTIIVDVKPLSGQVLYKSKLAPRLTEWKGKPYPADYDLLQVMIEEGHLRGLKVHAGFNVFCEGHKFFNVGPVYDTHPEWQSIVYTQQGLIPITQDSSGYAAMVNPSNPDVQKYELSILEEILQNYDVDGVTPDRVRYNGINADFSELSRSQFEKFIRLKRISRWPEDIYTLNADGTRTPGKYYKPWLYWRAKVIYDYFVQMRRLIERIKPQVKLGDYAGSWYPSYYEVGVNWASRKYTLSQNWAKSWASPEYPKTGYAELLDYFCAGCYFKEITINELLKKQGIPAERREAAVSSGWEPWNSVEGACDMVEQVVHDGTYVYGTIYVLDYKGNPELFKQAVQMCQQKTNGVGIFDLVYIEEYNWWHILEDCFPTPTIAPHESSLKHR